MRQVCYILDAKKRVVRARNVAEWGRFFESGNRIVSQDDISGGVHVSTVFLGIDHRHFGKGPPIVFETMIFGGELDQSTYRYSSWDDAETGHAAAIRKVKKAVAARPGTQMAYKVRSE